MVSGPGSVRSQSRSASANFTISAAPPAIARRDICANRASRFQDARARRHYGHHTLDDAGALALIKAHLDRDARMNALRQKALGDFQKLVGTKLAARAIQVDRRLSLAYQLQIVSQIPLVH